MRICSEPPLDAQDIYVAADKGRLPADKKADSAAPQKRKRGLSEGAARQVH